MENVQYNPYYDEPKRLLFLSLRIALYYEDILRTIINQTNAKEPCSED